MGLRTPPSNTSTYSPRPYLVFEKSSGTKGSTFVARLIQRRAQDVHRRSGEIVPGVRYARELYPVYEPETFAAQSKQWIAKGDLVYGTDYEPLKLPLEHPYLFDCDKSYGFYD